jgi:ribosomal protein L9
MQVILLETIGKMGGLGDVANVKAGYARFFLSSESLAFIIAEAPVMAPFLEMIKFLKIASLKRKL